jgi:hypothetical protein
MPKLPLAIAAVAALGACSTPPQQGGPAQYGANIVTNVQPYRAGSGVVQNIYPVPSTAAAGGSSAMQRLEVRMSDGTVQYVDAPSGEFTKGARVQLTEDKHITPM